MLTQLAIRDYAIVDTLDLELAGGMTAITGETGAGKSILLGALGLCLGERADAASVRHGCERADLSASFDIQALPAARAWLEERELPSDDCLRNVLSVFAIFSYGLRKAAQQFEGAGIPFKTITNFDILAENLHENDQLTLEEKESLLEWRDELGNE